MVRQTASLVFLEILIGLILIVCLVAGALAFRLASGPLDLAMFKDDVERALSEGRGRPVKIGSVQLEWSGTDRRVLITGQDIELFDDAGQLGAEAQHARIVLSGSSLVLGHVEVLRLALSDGWVNVDQVSPVKWTVAGDPLPEIPAGVLPQTPSEWLERANQVLPPLLAALNNADQTFALESVRFERMEFRVRDTNAVPLMTLADAQGRLAREEDGIALDISGRGESDGAPAGLAVTLKSTRADKRLHAEFAVADWPLADLARRLGMPSDEIDGLSASAEVAFDVSEDKGVDLVTLHAQGGAGRVAFFGGLDVKDFDATLTYEAGTDKLRVDLDTAGLGPLSGKVSFSLDDILLGDAAHDFALASDGMTLDLTPRFAEPIALQSVHATGALAVKDKLATGMDLSFVKDGATFHVRGDLGATPDRKEGELPVQASLTLETEGNVSKETVLAFWPVKLGDSARRFTDERITAEEVSNIKGRADLKRDSLAQGFLRDGDLEITFAAKGANVKFLSDLPPVENGVGTGRLTGNSFLAVLDSGDYGGWQIDEAAFDLPEFNPKGKDFRVFAKGRGPVENVIKTLAASRLQVKFDPARLSGDADVTFELFRPATGDVPFEDVRFTAIGTISDAGLKDAALGFDLTKSTGTVKVDQNGMTITGQGLLGPSPVQFTWRDGFGDAGAPSHLSASSVVTPDFLNQFGILGRAYLSGEIPMEVQAEIGDESIISADAALDLGESRLDMSEIGWVKAAGKPARASVAYVTTPAGYDASVLFKADDAYLDGDFSIGKESKLMAATLRRAFLKNRADVAGSVERRDNQGLDVSLTGAYLDISGALPGVGAIGSSKGAGKTPMSIDANVDALTLRPGLDMRKAHVTLESNADGIQSFSAMGAADDGSSLEASFTARPEGSRLKVVSGDAGFLASAFLGADFLQGGKLELDGTLAAEGRPAKFDIAISGARMRNAPFLTQILSLASLRGLADTLGGEGVLFSRIDIPLTIAGDRYVVDGGKAQGPALGLTANGFLESKSGEMSIDGVLVPSFGMNSALGGIPIIGDLVVGRDGEGVFSLTYSIRGTTEKANVSVNPLSALAPGVIRRIFENPANTKIPEAKPRPPEEAIPSELPPINGEEF